MVRPLKDSSISVYVEKGPIIMHVAHEDARNCSIATFGRRKFSISHGEGQFYLKG